MIIQLTEDAERKLKEKIGSVQGSVRLIYDTEGCGCAVNGIPGLRIIDEPDQDDVPVEAGDSIPFVINRMQEIFFEDSLKLDVHPGLSSFRLDSSSQTYGTNIQLVDTRL
ncbi:iron-sulfur cluster biosynthesis family protein [Paenibacillus dakarensis]|uniref:iron-sulfur cluster biosynthesis family protein n=1 Tax=Paenibacillus dakarensis TaxID=1527293 RepID=UPI0006D593BB|nr:iron-sulfur cluster biosynthesis family protein [Paenibacillus dakarensis]